MVGAKGVRVARYGVLVGRDGCWWLETRGGGLRRVFMAGYGVLLGRDAWLGPENRSWWV